MKSYKRSFSSFLLCAGLFCACTTPQEQIVHVDMGERVMIPLSRKRMLPDTMTQGRQTFVLEDGLKVYTTTDAAIVDIAKDFIKQVRTSSGITLDLAEGDAQEGEKAIFFGLDSIAELEKHPEGYQLRVTNEALLLKGTTPQGVYRGLQSVYQLLPDEITKAVTVIDSVHWAIPGVELLDYPEFQYRGAMLDVARHFFSVDDVKRYIDLIAQYKLNTLHLHLTDDQGWRIEIKSWPRLTEIGGKTAVGGGEGGYYTQEEYVEIVRYAAAKYITIIPEIDMPGHTNAALVAYDTLNCNGKSPKMYTGMRVGFSSFCVDKEVTYTFIDDVMRELSALTPGAYIHIGGDESHATSKRDYITFLNRVKPILTKYNKKMMGWEDISAITLEESDIVQHWTNAETASRGVKDGARVVLSPAPKTYLDMKYNKDSRIGLKWAGPTSVDSAYLWKPYELLKDIPKEKILGIESPLWGETIVTMDDIEFLAFPRIIGHAELGWSDPALLDWASYKARMQRHKRRMKLQDINFYASPLLFEAENKY